MSGREGDAPLRRVAARPIQVRVGADGEVPPVIRIGASLRLPGLVAPRLSAPGLADAVVATPLRTPAIPTTLRMAPLRPVPGARRPAEAFAVGEAVPEDVGVGPPPRPALAVPHSAGAVLLVPPLLGRGLEVPAARVREVA